MSTDAPPSVPGLLAPPVAPQAAEPTPAPWQCPACLVYLAPHVTEHRCDPPESGVTAFPVAPGPAGSTGTSISTATLPGTVTVNVSGSAVSEQELVRTVQRSLLRVARNRAALVSGRGLVA